MIVNIDNQLIIFHTNTFLTDRYLPLLIILIKKK